MITFPNAKINLGLHVLSRRPDGYHNIETLFYPVKIHDVLEVVESDKLRFSSSGIAIPGSAETNLCIKAYELIRSNFNLPPVHIHLHKHIPIGAGLGGGSADAAFFIRLLNENFDLQMSDDLMMNYACRLGADCAFFITNKPAMAKGIGDELSVSDLDLNEYFLVVVMPQTSVSTAGAYRYVVPKSPPMQLFEALRQNITDWEAVLSNDFENSVFVHHPKIRSAKEALYEAGALYACMSGSGAAVFGIFRDKISLPDMEKDHCIFYGV